MFCNIISQNETDAERFSAYNRLFLYFAMITVRIGLFCYSDLNYNNYNTQDTYMKQSFTGTSKGLSKKCFFNFKIIIKLV